MNFKTRMKNKLQALNIGKNQIEILIKQNPAGNVKLKSKSKIS